MAIECDEISFELHSSILNPHYNGDVFNQRLVISPRTGIFHACLSLKRQILTTLASGEKKKKKKKKKKKNDFCSKLASRTTIPFRLYGRLCKGLNYTARFLISAIMPKCQPYFNGHLPSSSLKRISAITSEDLLTIFFSQHGVARVEISSRAVSLSLMVPF